MTISLIPLLAIILINVTVIGYVTRLSGRGASGFFLVINALSLIIWAGGSLLYAAVGDITPLALALPYFAGLLVPANFLYYALSHPRPLRPSWEGPLPLALIFGPAVVLPILQPYTYEMAALFDYSYRTDQFVLGGTLTRTTILYSLACLIGSVVVFGIRYHSSPGSKEQVIAKHLIVSITGPFLFAAFFWAASRQDGPSLLPSPSLLLALMAQIGIIAVLRQEDLRSPRFLSRALYHITAVLVAFLVVSLMTEFYVYVMGRFVLDRTVGWMVLGATLVLILAARFSRVESTLDRLLFTRAAEYRRLVQETQQELREARERLRRSERLSVVGELAARVAHEIKNPLGPIKGYTQIMREKLEEEKDFRHREAFLRHLDVITEEAENIDRRVRQFLNSARQPQLLLDSVDINKLVERCARLLNLEAAATVEPLSGLHIVIETDLEDKLGSVIADAGRVEEVVFNVTRNALDALTGRGGEILITTRSALGEGGERGVEILIQDTGPGFGPGGTDVLFDPFYSEKPEGTGLGLAIVKSALAAHGGTIVLRNRPEGGGEVRLWLPRTACPAPGAFLPKSTTLDTPVADSGPEESTAAPAAEAATGDRRQVP